MWNKSYSGKFAKIWANSLLLPQKINCSYTFEANYKLPKNNNHKIFAQISQRISEPRTFRKGNDINFQSLFPIIGKPFDDLYCTIKVKTTFRAHGGCKLSCTPGSYSEFLRFTNSMLCLVRMRSHGSARIVFTLEKQTLGGFVIFTGPSFVACRWFVKGLANSGSQSKHMPTR